MTATIPKGFHPEPFSYHQELELDIDALSNAGDGIGRVNGWVVFVPFALPGDRVKARVWRNDRNYSSADLVEVLRPSPDRVDPVCRLFGTCGGCSTSTFPTTASFSGKRARWRTSSACRRGWNSP